jgi:hypothetical protein
MIDEKVAKSRITTDFDLKKYLNKNGYFLDENGQFIFTNTVVKVQGQVSHRFIPGRVVPETELANYGATLAEKEVTSKELVD